MTTNMTKCDSKKYFYMLDTRSISVQKMKGSPFRRYSIDIGLEERKLVGNMSKVNSLDQSKSQPVFSSCTKNYEESIILENEEPGNV